MIGNVLRRQDEQETAQGNSNATLVRQRSWGEYLAILANLFGVREAWGMGSIDELGNAYGSTSQGRLLTKVGGTTFNVHNHVVPYANYNGTTGYHTRADENGLDLLGNEAVIESSIQGMTLLVWYWANAIGAEMRVVHKGDSASAANSNFLFQVDAAGVPTFSVYSGGAVETVVGAVVSAAAWHCAICRFKNATEISMDSDGTKTLAASALTSLNNSNKALVVGAGMTGAAVTTFLPGRVAALSLAGAWIDDDVARFLYRYGRALLR